MSTPEKRARQKANKALARAEREQAVQQQSRNDRMRTSIIIGVVVAVLVGAFIFFTRDDSDGDDAASATTTTVVGDETSGRPTVQAPAADVLDPASFADFTEATAGPPFVADTADAAAVDAVTCSEDAPDVSAGGTITPEIVVEPGVQYQATIATNCGEIVMGLDPSQGAPVAVNNFVTLAQQGFYDGLTWHRVVKDFVIQGGDPAGNGTGGPGYSLPDEETELPYKVGDVAMAYGSAVSGSQFFVVTGSNTSALDQAGKYPRIGVVTSGMDVAKKIESFAIEEAPSDGPPTQPAYIYSITIQTVGDEADEAANSATTMADATTTTGAASSTTVAGATSSTGTAQTTVPSATTTTVG